VKSFAVFIRVFNLNVVLVDAASVAVGPGGFSYNTSAGRTKNWIKGRYTVMATYGVNQQGRATSIKTSFDYAGPPELP